MGGKWWTRAIFFNFDHTSAVYKSSVCIHICGIYLYFEFVCGYCGQWNRAKIVIVCRRVFKVRGDLSPPVELLMVFRRFYTHRDRAIYCPRHLPGRVFNTTRARRPARGLWSSFCAGEGGRGRRRVRKKKKYGRYVLAYALNFPVLTKRIRRNRRSE